MTDVPLVRILTIKNRKGLHARASAKLVQLVAGFKAQIWVARDGTKVVGTSIMGLLMLAAAPGCTIEVTASGPEAKAALDAIAKLVDARFDESE